jgi:hypothetical protein
VSDRFVNGVRAALTPNIRSEPRAYTTKHGTTATMTVTNIGAKPAASSPSAPAKQEWQQTDVEDIASPLPYGGCRLVSLRPFLGGTGRPSAFHLGF